MRSPGKATVDVGNQLYGALKKRAQHTRLIFIEVNVPDDTDDQRTVEVLGGVLKSLRARETTLTIAGQPAPPAYVVVTNNPFHYSPNAPCKRCGLVEGFKMPDFRFGEPSSSLREALTLREKHQEILCLMESMAKHTHPPSTFDGEIPEFAFDQKTERLIIGDKYVLPDGDGGEVIGELQHATVMETEKTAFGIYKLPDGRNALFTCPLTDDELAAYKKHPDTFFGINKPHTKGIHDPLKLFDWLFSSYGRTPREKLLEFMKNSPDFDELQKLSQKDLAVTYCERLVHQIMGRAGAPQDYMSSLVARVVAETSKTSLKET
jgi:hypothetical protein